MPALLKNKSVVFNSHQDVDACPTPVGNATYIVELENILVGDTKELFALIEESQIAAFRSAEPTESAERVFAQLGI